MRRRARTTLWLAALAAALLIAGIETLRHEYEREETTRAPLLVLAPERVRALHIARAGKRPVHLEQASGNWRMTSPMPLPADELRVTRLIDELNFRRALKVNEAQPGQDAFGLDAPAVSFVIETGTASHKVGYGAYHPIENLRYATINDVVYLVEAELYPALLAQDLFMAEHYLLPRDFHPVMIEYQGQRVPLTADPGADGLARTAWENARALSVEPAQDAAAGVPLFIEAADGRRIQLRRQPSTANLQLGRPELGIRYQLQSGLAAELLPPEHNAGTTGG